MSGSWVCVAYGDDPAVVAAGALCFFAEPGGRTCPSEAVCHAAMAEERRRVFRAINEKAAAEDEPGGPFAYLESQFASPEQLLNADQPDDDEGGAPGEGQA